MMDRAKKDELPKMQGLLNISFEFIEFSGLFLFCLSWFYRFNLSPGL
jgi:hypothetical protein